MSEHGNRKRLEQRLGVVLREIIGTVAVRARHQQDAQLPGRLIEHDGVYFRAALDHLLQPLGYDSEVGGLTAAQWDRYYGQTSA